MRVVDRTHALAIAIGRVVIGAIFLWAGLEKLIGGDGQGGSWTAAAFLKFATNGTLGWPFVTGTPDPKTIYNPTHDFWVNLAGNASAMTAVNTLVIAGEIGIGIALVLGLLTRFAAGMATLMMLFFFVAAWSFSTGIVNQHLTYAVVAFGLGVIGAGNYYGLDAIIGPRFSHGVRRYLFSGDVHDGWKIGIVAA